MASRKAVCPVPDPPHGLSARSAELWAGVVRWADTPGRLAVLAEALRALDRADEARAAVDRDGLCVTTPGSGVVHLHPAAKLEREARAQFAALWADLGLAEPGLGVPWP